MSGRARAVPIRLATKRHRKLAQIIDPQALEGGADVD